VTAHHYLAGRAIEQFVHANNLPFYGLIQAAMRGADTVNMALLRQAFPAEWEDLQRRYHEASAETGLLPEERGDGAEVVHLNDLVHLPDRTPVPPRYLRPPAVALSEAVRALTEVSMYHYEEGIGSAVLAVSAPSRGNGTDDSYQETVDALVGADFVWDEKESAFVLSGNADG
jgi:hypothetical protein